MSTSSTGENDRQIYYSVGDIADRFNLPPHKIRYWSQQFEVIEPDKTPGGNRRFHRREIDTFETIYNLVEEEGYTVKGARNKLNSSKPVSTSSDYAKQIARECSEALEDINQFIENL